MFQRITLRAFLTLFMIKSLAKHFNKFILLHNHKLKLLIFSKIYWSLILLTLDWRRRRKQPHYTFPMQSCFFFCVLTVAAKKSHFENSNILSVLYWHTKMQGNYSSKVFLSCWLFNPKRRSIPIFFCYNNHWINFCLTVLF